MIALVLVGCGVLPGTNCNQMFIESGLTVHVDGELEDGHYVLEAVEGDDTLTECAFEIGGANERGLCDGSRVELGEDGVVFRITPDLPEDVEIVLWQDLDVLGAQVFEDIEYEELEYNGKGCSVAHNAEVTFTL